MSGCTETDKPLISIVMAVYHPRTDWLVEQLDSLNAQSYPNLELIVCDDGADAPVAEEAFAGHITAFHWELVRNEENMGSNKTFERLTQMVRGEYIAYCDQDDVWLPEKIETLMPFFVESAVNLVCSDMFIIDGEGRQKADSITKVRRHHVFRNGGMELTEKLLFSNFVTGCAMMIRSETAKAAIPFCPYMVHDHYLAFYSSLHGQIRSVPRALLRYRLHGGNQTGVMAGVFDKQSYLQNRILEPLSRLRWLQERFGDSKQLTVQIEQGICWLEARRDNMKKVHGNKKTVWKHRKLGPLAALFEMLAPQLPQAVFMLPIRMQAKKR